MGKYLSVLLCALLLGGCAGGQEYETVRDAMPTCDPGDAPYEISISIPQDAVLVEETDTQRVYASPDGDLEITARVLVTDGPDAAVYALAGIVRPLRRITLENGEECQLAWSVETDRGPAVCRAKIRLEGDFAYCLCLRLKAGLGGEYNDRINALFSSFSLVPKESEDIPQARNPGSPDSAPRTSRCRRSAPPPSYRRGSR